MSSQATGETPVDLFIIGGGINGCGIARDAAGRGLSVTLAEMGDLAQATSSASTKLFHGGLRYLEYFEFRLVREALEERETLLVAMPHISWPMRFVLPWQPEMRFESDTPTSRILGRLMPWMKGRRPAWLIRLALETYDRLGGRRILPPARALDLTRDAAGKPLQRRFTKGWEYSDCWVEDARLVALNARDAEDRGAEILTRTKVIAAERQGSFWRVTTEGPGGLRRHRASALVNAGGPWVERIVRETLHLPTTEGVRLVRGSHIVTRRLFDHDRCYFFQGTDGRIVFAIPFETDFTLIGTTDRDHDGPPETAVCTEAEQDYLCAFASQYFERPVTRADIVWTYSGVRPLYNDGAKSATAATRDYVLSLDRNGPPLLNVFGGKITTYRRLAEGALARLRPFFPEAAGPWTAGVPLPGGDFPWDGAARLAADLRRDHPYLTERWALRLVRAYGTEARKILGPARRALDLGRDFGATLTEAEVRWLMAREHAERAEDVVWRRSKLGLRMTEAEIAALDGWMAAERAEKQDPAPGPGGEGGRMTLELRGVSRVVAGRVHVHPTDLVLQGGTMNVLLGPTLAGKTSLMRLMAGLDAPSAGRILWNGADVTGQRVQDRRVAMVYQQFINYPSMTVYENIASPLRLQGRPKPEIDREVRAVAEMLKLSPMLDRRPLQLSGGQQQRCALARALVKGAGLVLLDEPLANLDYKLREELRLEIPRIFEASGAIFVYATTEPEEALLLGGNTATLWEGRITQFGPTPQVYRQPVDATTARVFSDPPMNFVAVSKAGRRLRFGDRANAPAEGGLAALADGRYLAGFRANHLALNRHSGQAVEFSCRLSATEITGSETFLHLAHGGDAWVGLVPGVHDIAPGTEVPVWLDPAHVYLFDEAGALVAPAAYALAA